MNAPAATPRRVEDPGGLWALVASPVAWAAHFLLSYVTAAIWCAKFPEPGTFGTVRAAIAGYTVAALAVVAWVGWQGYVRHRAGGEPPPHGRDTPEDRARFLGFATLLLSGLSAVAILYAALTLVFFRSCA